MQELQQAFSELRDDTQRLFHEFQNETRTMFLTIFEHAGIRIPLCVPTVNDPALPWTDVDTRPATRDAHTFKTHCGNLRSRKVHRDANKAKRLAGEDVITGRPRQAVQRDSIVQVIDLGQTTVSQPESPAQSRSTLLFCHVCIDTKVYRYTHC